MEWNAEIENGLREVSARLNDLRTPEGHWVGELSSSALSTATAITAIAFYLEATGTKDDELEKQVDAGISWLVEQQNGDGGFGDTSLSHSNISTTMLAVAALHACGKEAQFDSVISNAQSYIDSKGGIKGLRARYGNDKTFAVPILAHCAMAGIVPWREVSALPFEAACVPQRFYNLMQLPVVSYAIPALVAIGQAKFFHDPPWDPVRKTIRRLCVEPSLKVLDRMQPDSGGFLEAVPLTSFVAMALVKCGRQDHPVVVSGIKFLRESFREEGTWPIDTNLATWGTTLAVNALANESRFFREQLSSNKDAWRNCVEWIIGCQTKTRHPFTGAQPGGFGWTDLSGAVPDADDTPGAMIALKHLSDNADAWCEPSAIDETKKEIEKSARAGVQWLVDLQNRDSGWPTFCKGWGKLPFDRSGADITAHSIRGLLAWQDVNTDEKIQKSIDRGFRYLERQQRPDGSWLPLWFGNQDTEDEINPWYGTAKVLLAYRDAKLFDTEPAKIGLEWILGSQNECGGWGGGESLNWAQLHQAFDKSGKARHSQIRDSTRHDFSLLGTSSVEETALCTETLLHAADCDSLQDPFREQLRESAARGVRWLLDAIEADCVSIHWPIGFYFAKLWYYEKMYPLVFTASALTKARSVFDREPQNDNSPNNKNQQQPERDEPGGTRRNIYC